MERVAAAMTVSPEHMVDGHLLVGDSLDHLLLPGAVIEIVFSHHLVVYIHVRLQVMVSAVISVKRYAADSRPVGVAADIGARRRRQKQCQVRIVCALVSIERSLADVSYIVVEGGRPELRPHGVQIRPEHPSQGRADDRGHQSADVRIALESVFEDIAALVRTKVETRLHQCIPLSREYLREYGGNQPSSHAFKSLRVHLRPVIINDVREERLVKQVRERIGRLTLTELRVRLVNQYGQVPECGRLCRNRDTRSILEDVKQAGDPGLHQGRHLHGLSMFRVLTVAHV